MKILTAQQMRELDRLTVERCGIPYATLMETAGSRVVEAIIENYGSVAGKSFAVFAVKETTAAMALSLLGFFFCAERR